MGTLNVNRNVDDAFYRYKMPRLLAKVEGKGNGIKTVIVNMTEIAKALERPPTYPTKFFGCELGAQTQVDTKNDRFIVNGEHDATKLQDILDGFIRKFVLCSECDNPETKLTVKRNDIHQACAACGFAMVLRSKHRLVTYIVKNPPGQDATDSAAGDKGKRGKGRGKKGKGNGSPDNSTAGGQDCVDGSNDVSGNASPDDDGAEANDEEWSVNPDDAAERQKAVNARMVALTMNEDLDLDEDVRLDKFYTFLKKENAKLADGELLDAKVVMAEADRLDIKEKAVLLVCRVLLDDNVIQELAANRSLFLRFTLENRRSQRYLLGGVEQLVESKPALLAKVSHILKAFYDKDIVEEETLLEWGEKSSKRYVNKDLNKSIREKAEPFLNWLREAEEETDDDSDDEDVVEFEGEDEEDAKAGKKRGAVAKVGGAGKDAGMVNGDAKPNKADGKVVANGDGPDDDEDVDIDDI